MRLAVQGGPKFNGRNLLVQIHLRLPTLQRARPYLQRRFTISAGGRGAFIMRKETATMVMTETTARL
jgi:hypothetical protein